MRMLEPGSRSISTAVPLLFGVLLATATILVPATADAFCGAYVSSGGSDLFNNATQVAMMRHRQTTVLSMQNNYEGPPKDFAMIVPTPQVLKAKNVKTIEDGVFDRIDRLTAPRLVEYWEKDPCQFHRGYDAGFGAGGVDAGAAFQDTGGGGGGDGYVEVEAKFDVGEYQVVVLDSNGSSTLETWLQSNGYNIPSGAEKYLQPYIQKGSYFFVAEVDIGKVTFEDGEAVLSPLRFHYESSDFKLPVRLGLMNSHGKQDLIVNVLAQDQRYRVSNYPHTTIPTNIEVVTRVKKHFPAFYRALFTRTLEKNGKKGTNPVVTEYAWNATSCDPCPTGERLTQDDLYTLGVDVVAEKYGSGSAGGDAGSRALGPEFRYDWVVTRMHTRYGADEIGADLVFEKADAIVGGREYTTNADGEISQEPQSSSFNSFQGRYIIRHHWDGPIECEDPQFGRWGAKHGGEPSAETAQGETNRSGGEDDPNVRLEEEILEDVDALGVTADPGRTDDGIHWSGNDPTTKESSNPSKAATRTCSTGAGEVPVVPTWIWCMLVAGTGWYRIRRH